MVRLFAWKFPGQRQCLNCKMERRYCAALMRNATSDKCARSYKASVVSRVVSSFTISPVCVDLAAKGLNCTCACACTHAFVGACVRACARSLYARFFVCVCVLHVRASGLLHFPFRTHCGNEQRAKPYRPRAESKAPLAVSGHTFGLPQTPSKGTRWISWKHPDTGTGPWKNPNLKRWEKNGSLFTAFVGS